MPLEDLIKEQTAAEDKRLEQAALEERAARQESIKRLEAAQLAKEPEIEKLGQARDEIRTLPTPKFQPPPEPPKTQEMLKPSSLQKTLGMASIFALMSVGLAKGSAIYGLKALGGFMEGAHAGNVEQAKASLDDFNSSMRAVHEANDNAYQEYNAIFNNTKLGMDAQLQMARQAALKFDDQLQIENLRNGDLVEFNKVQQQRFKNQIEMDKELGRNERAAMQMAGRAARAGNAVLGIPMAEIPQGVPGQKNEAFLQMLAPGQQEIVKRMAAGDLEAGIGGFGSALRSEYTSAATIYDPSFKARTSRVMEKTAKEATPGGPVGTNVLALNTMTHHLNDFAEGYKQLSNSQVQRWNSAKNKLATEFGDPALSRVQVSGLAAAGELAKVVKGGRAAPTDIEMAAWEKVFNTSMSKSQVDAVVWQALQTAGGRLASIEEAYKQQGVPLEALYPDTKKIILSRKPRDTPWPGWLRMGGQSQSSPQGGGKVTLEEAKEMIRKYGSVEKAMEAARQQGLQF